MSVPELYAADPFLAIQQALASPWLDAPMSIVTRACEGWAVGLIGILYLGWRERPRSRREAPFAGEGKAALLRVLRTFAPLLVALVVVGFAVQGLKALVHTPRPLAVYGPDAIHQLLEPLRYSAFPSGHSASAGTLAAFVTGRYGRTAWPFWLFALVGGLSRIYVGAHWTLDVLGGLALGALFGWVAYALARRARLVPQGPAAVDAGAAPPAA
jgi:membrane-associated phospholipid phosphatase